ncbi:phospholipase D/nuclease [Lophiostoma macrostomum CBS 122681]|uniref:Phospholipase D/nuclease n=1 Tax=Lophiostoma macrostomum CBS 122681 TaxID=1314788 RepID=A0A6A6TCK6_9PLEO|nr:phospholipase D/nuclease [Lophiostoma macrostomum CBS 122681]
MNGTSAHASRTHITSLFTSSLNSSSKANSRDDPNYYVPNTQSLITSSTVHSFATGTGSRLYDSLTPVLKSTNSELILVTCFWARSPTLSTLSSVLRHLSEKAIHRGTDKIRVRLCFSSLSLFQKLFHKQSTDGQYYSPDVWEKKLGLPPPGELTGLDLTIKSVFVLPFSVMHPKFMIIDRRIVVLPSCNISWEEWFEGYLTLSGAITDQFLNFYSAFWDRKSPRSSTPSTTPIQKSTANPSVVTRDTGAGAGTELQIPHSHGYNMAFFHPFSAASFVPTIFLPSPHHRNPRFSPFISLDKSITRAPPTPLNLFILTLLEKAEHTIRIQTPNLTSPPVLSALLRALERGVHVKILTSERLMVLEQLVTAGTTTKRCINRLIKRYERLLLSTSSTPSSRRPRTRDTDEEAAIAALPIHPGNLQISYFAPVNGPKKRGREGGEPQQSHLKMLIVDSEILVLGSGNLDRASWFTSQELGIAVLDDAVTQRVGNCVDEGMKGRSRCVFDSVEG